MRNQSVEHFRTAGPILQADLPKIKVIVNSRVKTEDKLSHEPHLWEREEQRIVAADGAQTIDLNLER